MDCVLIRYGTINKACWFLVHKYNKTYWFLVHKFENFKIYVNMIIELDNAKFFKHICLCKIKCVSSSERSKWSQEEQKNSISNMEGLRCTKHQQYSLLLD